MSFWKRWGAQFLYNAGTMSRFWGLRYHHKRYFQSAERLFTRALALDDNVHRARLNRGILRYRELGNWKDALADFTALVERGALVEDALFNRGMAHYHGADYHAAASDFERFLEIAPESMWAETAFIQLHMMRSIIEDLRKQVTDTPPELLLPGST